MRYRPTVVEVDLEAVRHNVRRLKPPAAELMAVVKADGYGHGDVPVARAALEAGATWLGVALVEEGIGLREAGIDAPILVLSEFPDGAEADGLAHDLTPTLYTEGGLERLAKAAAPRGHPVAVHVKLDTGMHRVGLWPPEAAPAFCRAVVDAGLELEGLWTHFASSESDEALTRLQLERLLAAAEAVRAEGLEPRLLHAANSAATLRYPETHLDLVRPGAALYGLAAGPGLAEGLRPAMTLRSEVTLARRLPKGERVSYGHRYELARDSWVATVPVGYEDGYPRLLSTRAEVLVGGRRHLVAGIVTMDQLLVDCGDDEVAAGDEVVLVGPQGAERVTAEELGELIGTIGYEIATAISERVPREYRG
ncbi:MAG: alanine racemase [Solirubrobacterales bacterium]